MGVVYKAEDTRLGRSVALKFLPDATPPRSESSIRAESSEYLHHPLFCVRRGKMDI